MSGGHQQQQQHEQLYGIFPPIAANSAPQSTIVNLDEGPPLMTDSIAEAAGKVSALELLAHRQTAVAVRGNTALRCWAHSVLDHLDDLEKPLDHPSVRLSVAQRNGARLLLDVQHRRHGAIGRCR